MLLRVFPIISPIIFGVIVLLLGFITPGYNHLRHTISRLAIEQYGLIQTLNFLQFSVGLFLSGLTVSDTIKSSANKSFVKIVFWFCAATTAIWGFVPTDRIEGNPLTSPLWSPTGIVHATMVIVLLLVTPIGLKKLTKILALEHHYKKGLLATTIIGYFALLMSTAWVLFFINNWLDGYRGLFQKIIAVPVLFWLVWVTHQAAKTKKI